MIFLSSIQGVLGQTFTIYNTANSALPYNTVNALALGPDSALWVGTEYGLACLHQGNWTVWQSATSGLPDDAVRAISADSNGVYVGMFTGGLARFAAGGWTTWNTFNSALPDDHVHDLLPISDSLLWIGTGGGLVRKSDTGWAVFNNQNSLLNSSNILCLGKGAGGEIYAGTLNGGLAVVEDTPVFVHTLVQGLPDNSINDVYYDPASFLCAATPAGGMGIYYGTNWAILLESNSGIPSNHITSLASDSAEHLWMGTFANGLARFRIKSGPTPLWTYYDSATTDLPDDRISCLLWDKYDQVLWIGTHTGGLVRFDPTPLQAVNDFDFPEFTVGPNPTTGQLNLSGNPAPETRINLYNSSGQLVQSLDWQRSMDLCSFPAGIYFLQITAADRILHHQKVVVVR
ncbi:MAG: T9SS type A sorting domain-containing protein [Bacteroidia bacterium]|nr:T9SS type A sorting domain-containing protein [Bacteroidia bacterium]